MTDDGNLQPSDQPAHEGYSEGDAYMAGDFRRSQAQLWRVKP